jgi:hypothetical protein
MKAIIKSFASNPEQFAAVKAFKLINSITYNGTLISFQEFDSFDAAQNFLSNRSRQLYFDEDVKTLERFVWSTGLIYKNAVATILTGEEMITFKIQIANKLKSLNHVQTTN